MVGEKKGVLCQKNNEYGLKHLTLFGFRKYTFCLSQFSQFSPQRFSEGALGEFVHELDRLRSLEGGEVLPAEIQEVLLTDRAGGLEGDKGLDHLAVHGIGDPDNPRFQDIRMHMKNIFDFFGVDIFSSPDDQVLFPVCDVNIIVFVHVSHIAGMEPPVPQRFGGLPRLVPVPLHHAGSFDDDLTDLTPEKFPIVLVEYLHRVALLITFADGTILGGSPSGYIAAVDGRRLAEAVSFPDIDSVSFFPLAGYLQGHGSRAADTYLQRAQVISGGGWMVQDLDIHGRNAAKIRDLELFDTAHRLFGIPPADDDEFPYP